MLAPRQIAAIAGKELNILLRDRQALALLFLMPGFFILIMSFALEGVFEAGTRDRPLEILVVNQDRGDLAGRTIAAASQLEGLALTYADTANPLSREEAERMIRNATARFALVFGPNYTDWIWGDRSGPGRPLVLIVDPAVNRQLQVIVRSTVEGIAEKIRLAARLPKMVQGTLAAVLGEAAGSLPEIESLLSDPAQNIPLDIVLPEASSRTLRPSSVEQNVPAYAIFGVFFIVLTIAKSFLRERTDGTQARLRTAPLVKPVYIIGKLLPYYLVNLLQVVLMFTIGVLVFGMTLGNLPAFALVSLATAAAANGLGVLVAALGRSEAQVDTLSVLLAITLSALGGLMVPAYVMPELLQTLSRFTPHAWALAGYQDVIVRGLTVGDVLPEAGVLLGFAAGFMVVGLWRLRLD